MLEGLKESARLAESIVGAEVRLDLSKEDIHFSGSELDQELPGNFSYNLNIYKFMISFWEHLRDYDKSSLLCSGCLFFFLFCV